MLAMALLLAATTRTAYPQAVSATLLGTVTDSSGAILADAKVVIIETKTGAGRTTQTNASGNYTFPNLAPGTYSVVVEAKGFKKYTLASVDVIVNSNSRVDAQLQLGDVSESIEVTAAPPMLTTDRADTGAKIETVQAASLPLGTNRNFQGLLNLVPGTTRASFQHSQFYNAVGSLQTQVNGQMRFGNNNMLEGIDNNQRTGALQTLIPPIEAIETVDVSTSNFEAELGRATGAVVNAMLKSGTNNVHGALYEFIRNSEMNARNFFDAKVGHLSYNYFGGNVGGPIRRDKLFYFADYLRVTDHQANSNNATVPSLAARGGDLSAAPSVLYDPATGAADGSGRTAFPSNRIPVSRINPVSAKLMALVPGPNQSFSEAAPSNNYFALLPFTKDTDSMDLKMNYNHSATNIFSGRFSFARPVVMQAPIYGMAGGPAQGAFAGTGIQKTYSGGVNYNRIFSPTLISEFRFGVSHYNNVARNTDYGTKASESLGIPGLNIDDWTSGIVGIRIDNGISNPMIGYSGSLPWIRAEANISAVNSWTRVAGNHTFKWGVDVRRLRDDLLQTQTFGSRGVYYFGANQTSRSGAPISFGNSIGSFLLDIPYQAGRDISVAFPAMRLWQTAAFAQDKWAATSRLTLDFGVRWEFFPPPTPRFDGGFSNYEVATNQLVVAGIGGNPSNLGMKTHYAYFAPRLGASFRMNERTVIRAGFGVSVAPYPTNSWAYNFPVMQNNQFQSTNSYSAAVNGSGQPMTFQNGFPPPLPAVIPTNGRITGDNNASYSAVNKDFKNPYLESWNLSVQRALPMGFTLDVAYVGNHGVHSPATNNLNAARVAGLGARGRPLYPRTADTNFYFQGFSSMYNALQTKLNRRYQGGLLITTSYTYGRGMGYQDGDVDGLFFYIGDGRRNYARNNFDRQHTYVQSFVYDLPFGRGKRWLNQGAVSQILGGWQTNGILTLMSGLPFTVRANGGGLNAPGNVQTADQVSAVTYAHGINIGNPWFSGASFTTPVGAVLGNVGRNSMTGPGFFNLDFSLFKKITITERIQMELRGEAMGATNTPQFSNPGDTVGNANYSFVTGAGGGRNLQIGIKLMF